MKERVAALLKRDVRQLSGRSLSPLGLSLCPSLLRGVGAARHLHHLALLLLDLLPHELGLLELLHQPEAAERPRGDPQEHEGLDAGVGREPVAACAAAGQRSAAAAGGQRAAAGASAGAGEGCWEGGRDL